MIIDSLSSSRGACDEVISLYRTISLGSLPPPESGVAMTSSRGARDEVISLFRNHIVEIASPA